LKPVPPLMSTTCTPHRQSSRSPGANAKQIVGAERPVGQHVAALGQGLDQIVPELSSAAVRLSETVRTAILRGMNSLCLGAIGAIPVNH
jgi:hypothetical protein